MWWGKDSKDCWPPVSCGTRSLIRQVSIWRSILLLNFVFHFRIKFTYFCVGWKAKLSTTALNLFSDFYASYHMTIKFTLIFLALTRYCQSFPEHTSLKVIVICSETYTVRTRVDKGIISDVSLISVQRVWLLRSVTCSLTFEPLDRFSLFRFVFAQLLFKLVLPRGWLIM